MQVVIREGEHEREVVVAHAPADAVVGDLLAQVGLGHANGVDVDGRYVDATEPLARAPIPDGAIIEPAAPHGPRPHVPPTAPVWLTAVAGTDAGARFPLAPGTAVIGRGADCHVRVDSPTVSDRHAAVHVHHDGTATVEDVGSRNGTWVDGVAVTAPTSVPVGHTVRVGAVVLRVDGPAPDDRPVGAGTHLAPGPAPFNRPPRTAPPPPPGPLTAPAAPDDDRSSQPLRIAVMLAPLAMGGAMIWLTGRVQFALFALLSPVMLIANWASSRRQTRRANRSETARFDRELAAFRDDAVALQAAERRRREHAHTDLGEVLRRSTAPSTRLWERRRDHADALRLRLGSADVAWESPVDLPDDPPAPEVAEVLAAIARLPQSPVDVDLGPGHVVGIVGNRDAGLALARSLVIQAAVLHGPADLRIAVTTEPEGARPWQWTTWLPHTRDVGAGAAATGRGRWLAADAATGHRLCEALLDAPPASPGAATLLVVDDLDLLTGRHAPARDLLAGAGAPTCGIVLARTADRLPASCTTVVEVASDLGDASAQWPTEGRRVDGLLVAGLAEPRARTAARALAHLQDPEQRTAGADLPTTVRLLPLLGMEDVSAARVHDAWSHGGPDPTPATAIGIAADGPVHLDLAADGPHGLVGGTTGSGKSELLRSLVAGMAARVDPQHLVFVLVDYKGGSAFDACARLPHVVGLVTDLDEHLGARALTSLEAELAHRERVLRAARAPDLPAYLAAGAPSGPLPRMVVVIDEFATLATELPDFLEALVGIAQRGRSLGVHLLLATQRPRGVVNANVRANTNLRVALRMQDAGESTDVIDVPDAAELDRATPGRAHVRRGHGDVVLVQTALATASAAGGRRGVEVVDLVLAPTVARPPDDAARTTGTTAAGHEAPTDLDQLVGACREAFARAGMPAPRRPWLPMLPHTLPLADLWAPDADHRRTPGTIPFALADDPAAQARRPVAWDPAEGHLAVFGMVGSGTTTALQAVGLAAARTRSPDDCHLYGLDFGGGGLQVLAELPHCAAVVGAGDREAQSRLLRRLRTEVERRRDLTAEQRRDEPLVVLLCDGVGAFLGEHDDPASQELLDDVHRVFRDGPGVGVVLALSGDRPAALPLRLGALVGQRVLLRHADPTDLATTGIRVDALPRFVPGRGIDVASSLVVQVGQPDLDADVAAAVAAHPAPGRAPATIATLPTSVTVDDLDAPAAPGPPVRAPIGLADADLAAAVLDLHPGDHVLVSGPPRSGRSTVLQTLSSQLRVARPDAIQVAICDPTRSPLHGWPSLDAAGSVAGLASALRAAADHHAPWVVLVDDAPGVEDVDDLLAGLLEARPDVHVVASGRPGDLRAAYGHWSRPIRRSRTGVLLQPDLAADGDLFSVRLPRRVTVPLVPGRGFLVQAGHPALVQFATPPARPAPGSLADDAEAPRPDPPQPPRTPGGSAW